MRSLPFVSIIIPVRNEEANLSRCLSGIGEIDYPKNKLELIIVDGGSTDKTVAIASSIGRSASGRSFKAKVFYNRQKIRATGCQIGVKKAKGEIIAFTDADCVVPKNWLKALLKYLDNDRVASVGGPNITPSKDTSFAKAAGEAIWLLTRAGSRYGTSGGKVKEIYHNPGCNVIYRKEAVNEVGGFDSHLLTCEDEELDFRIRQAGYKLLFAPKVIVDHYRRPTYKRIYIQAYRFACGRMQAIKKHRQMARWFHFVPSVLLVLTLFFFSLIPLSFILPKIFHPYILYSLFYILFLAIAFLVPSIFLAITKKTASYHIYLFIFMSWFTGWGLGFMRPFFQSPESREKRKKR